MPVYNAYAKINLFPSSIENVSESLKMAKKNIQYIRGVRILAKTKIGPWEHRDADRR